MSHGFHPPSTMRKQPTTTGKQCTNDQQALYAKYPLYLPYGCPCTHHQPNVILVCCSLIQGLIQDDVHELIKTTKDASHLPVSIKLKSKLLVELLLEIGATGLTHVERLALVGGEHTDLPNLRKLSTSRPSCARPAIAKVIEHSPRHQ